MIFSTFCESINFASETLSLKATAYYSYAIKNPTPEGPVLVTPRGGYFALAPGGGKDELSTN